MNVKNFSVPVERKNEIGDEGSYRLLADLVYQEAGINLKSGKDFLIETRLARHISELGLNSLSEYVRLIQENGEEKQVCLELLTTHKTEWFREIVHYQWLKKQIPTLLEEKRPIQVWSAACSTGPEVYSTLFLFLKEGLKANQFRILGTDISRPVLDQALEMPQTPEFLEQYRQLKTRSRDSLHLEDELQSALAHSIKFREFNLVASQLSHNILFDVIFLRNVLIYFDRETVKKVCQKLTHYLKPGGHLILGLSESLHNDLPELVMQGQSIYQFRPPGFSTTLETQKPSPKKLVRNTEFQRGGLSSHSARVLIVEDSKPVAKILERVYSQIPGVELVGVAASVDDAVRLYQDHQPDFVSLDMKLEGGTGIDFLKRVNLRNTHGQVKCVLVTDLSLSEGNLVFEALDLGADSYVQKPEAAHLEEFADELKDLLGGLFETTPNRAEDISLQRVPTPSGQIDLDQFDVVAIGSSTGGTEVVRDLICGFPEDSAPIVVVQHMPVQFTGLFAERISKQSGKPTFEVKEKMKLERGCAYIASGGIHLTIRKEGASHYAVPTPGELVNRFKPSVSVLFESISNAQLAPRALAIMLTGMGKDGAREMLKLKDGGTMTIGQSKESCVVYGMPRAAQELGALQWSGSPEEIIAKMKGHSFSRVPVKVKK